MDLKYFGIIFLILGVILLLLKYYSQQIKESCTNSNEENRNISQINTETAVHMIVIPKPEEKSLKVFRL